MDVPDGVPGHLLGYKIKTRTQILFGCLIPTCLEFVAYLIQFLADTAVAIQHFRDSNSVYGWPTVILICLPALVCFVSIMTSPWQWPNAKGWSRENFTFFFQQLFNFLLFPIGAVYRFCRRIFWSIESLFHGKETYKRQHSVSKAAETSPFELYHFVQAYTQAAPQIILQLFILLREDIFRNYETTNVQVLSVVFSLANMATMTMSFNRFESQKIVGRHYPWSTENQIQLRNNRFKRTRSHIEEIQKSRKQGEASIRHFPENEKILERFNSQKDNRRSSVSFYSIQEKDNQKLTELNNKDENGTKKNERELGNVRADLISRNITDDEKMNSSDYGQESNRIMPDELDAGKGKRISSDEEDINAIEVIEEISIDSHENIRIQDMEFDAIPAETPPLLPPSVHDPASASSYPNGPNVNNKQQQHFNPIKRLSTLKDMLLLKAELYIKEHVPHPPRILVERALSREEREVPKDIPPGVDYKKDISDVNRRQSRLASSSAFGTEQMSSDAPNSPDTVDFFLPTKRKMIKGVEQDDFIGKFISFFGWILFIFMRMISLAVFAHFYPDGFCYLVGGHYLLMVVCLILESRLHEKVERIAFYLLLAYIYVFVILEFRIKFKRVKRWYVGYFLLVMAETFATAIQWYAWGEFESWIFGFLFASIVISAILFVACLFVYYIILKPKEVILLEDAQ